MSICLRKSVESWPPHLALILPGKAVSTCWVHSAHQDHLPPPPSTSKSAPPASHFSLIALRHMPSFPSWKDRHNQGRCRKDYVYYLERIKSYTAYEELITSHNKSSLDPRVRYSIVYKYGNCSIQRNQTGNSHPLPLLRRYFFLMPQCLKFNYLLKPTPSGFPIIFNQTSASCFSQNPQLLPKITESSLIIPLPYLTLHTQSLPH